MENRGLMSSSPNSRGKKPVIACIVEIRPNHLVPVIDTRERDLNDVWNKVDRAETIVAQKEIRAAASSPEKQSENFTPVINP